MTPRFFMSLFVGLVRTIAIGILMRLFTPPAGEEWPMAFWIGGIAVCIIVFGMTKWD